MTEKSPNQKAGLSGLCAGGGCGNSIGPGNPTVMCTDKYQQRNWGRMCHLLPGAVVPRDVLTLRNAQTRKTYGLTFDSASLPASSASMMLKVPLLVSLFHVIISTK